MLTWPWLPTALIEELQSLKPVRSSEVCKQCLSANSRAIWLTWLTCTNDSHTEDYVTVIVDDDRLTTVREWNPNQQLALCKNVKNCKKEICEFAHNQKELDYWRWMKITRDIYEKLASIPYISTLNICESVKY